MKKSINGYILTIAGFVIIFLAIVESSYFVELAFAIIGIVIVLTGILGIVDLKKNRAFSLRIGYKNAAVIILNTSLLFVLINLVFHFTKEYPANFNNNFTDPAEMFSQKPQIMRAIYDGYSDAEINQIINPPQPTYHPKLGYRTYPITSDFYNVGFEGMRYTSLINASNSEDKINNSIWVFGGSTVFGNGVADDETIPFYLDQIDTSYHYINFGVPGYTQNEQMSKLLLLLNKGYRPKKIIFIDGINDLIQMFNQNFEPLEKPVIPGMAYGFRFQINPFRTHLNYRFFPLIDYLINNRNITRSQSIIDRNEPTQYENIYDKHSLYNIDPDMHYDYYRQYGINGQHMSVEKLHEKVNAVFNTNQKFLEQLALGFDFEYFQFLQPIGIYQNENPFIKDRSFKNFASLYQKLTGVFEALKSDIKQNRLGNYYDISDVHHGVVNGYVDKGHYSPILSEKIARKINQVMLQEYNPKMSQGM